jgi:hypothetical protein
VYRSAVAAHSGARTAIAALPQQQKSFARALVRTKIVQSAEIPMEWAFLRHFLKMRHAESARSKAHVRTPTCRSRRCARAD